MLVSGTRSSTRRHAQPLPMCIAKPRFSHAPMTYPNPCLSISVSPFVYPHACLPGCVAVRMGVHPSLCIAHVHAQLCVCLAAGVRVYQRSMTQAASHRNGRTDMWDDRRAVSGGRTKTQAGRRTDRRREPQRCTGPKGIGGQTRRRMDGRTDGRTDNRTLLGICRVNDNPSRYNTFVVGRLALRFQKNVCERTQNQKRFFLLRCFSAEFSFADVF